VFNFMLGTLPCPGLWISIILAPERVGSARPV